MSVKQGPNFLSGIQEDFHLTVATELYSVLGFNPAASIQNRRDLLSTFRIVITMAYLLLRLFQGGTLL